MNHFEIDVEVCHESVIENGNSMKSEMEKEEEVDDIEHDGYFGFGFFESNGLPQLSGFSHEMF